MSLAVNTLNAGDMDRRIDLQQQVEPEGVDSERMPIERWEKLASIYAMRTDLRGHKYFQNYEVTATQTAHWAFWYRRDMDPETINIKKLRRVIADGRTYDIVAAEQIGRRVGILLVCVAKEGT